MYGLHNNKKQSQQYVDFNLITQIKSMYRLVPTWQEVIYQNYSSLLHLYPVFIMLSSIKSQFSCDYKWEDVKHSLCALVTF